MTSDKILREQLEREQLEEQVQVWFREPVIAVVDELEALTALKVQEAVNEVIGVDENMSNEMVSMGLRLKINEEVYTEYMLARNNLRAEQRTKLAHLF